MKNYDEELELIIKIYERLEKLEGAPKESLERAQSYLKEEIDEFQKTKENDIIDIIQSFHEKHRK